MFIKNNDSGLVFIKSKNINAFPCGRRRSNLIDTDGDSNTATDRYYIPFDPEARLNTEANNRKHTSLNGFKQSYIQSWVNGSSGGAIRFVVDGYLFKVKLEPGYHTPELFGAMLENASYLGQTTSIYANIKLSNVKFFSGTATVPEAATEVLRDQVLSDEPATCLDFIIDANADKSSSDSYYFSGLSLSTEDLTNEELGIVSFLLLSKNNGIWEIHNPSRLPKIEHGNTRDSVQINGDLFLNVSQYGSGSIHAAGNAKIDGTITANTADVEHLKQNGHPTALLDIVPITGGDGSVRYQLKFTGAAQN